MKHIEFFYKVSDFVKKPAIELVDGDKIAFHSKGFDRYEAIRIRDVDITSPGIVVYYMDIYQSGTSNSSLESSPFVRLLHVFFDPDDVHCVLECSCVSSDLVMVLRDNSPREQGRLTVDGARRLGVPGLARLLVEYEVHPNFPNVATRVFYGSSCIGEMVSIPFGIVDLS